VHHDAGQLTGVSFFPVSIQKKATIIRDQEARFPADFLRFNASAAASDAADLW
jgi:hypothetical protein